MASLRSAMASSYFSSIDASHPILVEEGELAAMETAFPG